MFVISMILLTAVTILLMHGTCGPLKLLKFKVMYKHDKAKKTKNVECFSQYKILRNNLFMRVEKLNKIILVVKYAIMQILRKCGKP